MIRSNFVKYLFVFALLFLNACDCPKELAPKKIGPLSADSANQSVQETIGTLIGTLYFDAVFGKSSNDINKKGLIGGRDFSTGIMGKMYKAIVQSNEYRAVYYLLFVLFLVVFGIRFAIGSTKMTMESILPIIFRVGVISLFTNPNLSSKNGLPIGWEYYYTFFIEPSLFAMEDFAMHFQAALYGWNINDVSNGFLPVTIVLGIFSQKDTWIRIISLIFSSPIPGFCCFLMVLFCILMFFITTFFAILTFASILTMLSLLFATGPFFFLFALFDKTRKYFFKWLMQILSFILQQYALFVTISIFGFIISECIRSMLSFDVRCDTILTFTLGLPIPNWLKILMPFLDELKVTFPLAKFYVANLYGDSAFVTIAFYGLFIYMLTQVFLKMMLKMVEVAGGLVVGTYTPSMASGAIEAANKIEGFAGKAGSVIGEVGGKAVNKINSKVDAIKKIELSDIKNMPDKIDKSLDKVGTKIGGELDKINNALENNESNESEKTVEKQSTENNESNESEKTVEKQSTENNEGNESENNTNKNNTQERRWNSSSKIDRSGGENASLYASYTPKK